MNLDNMLALAAIIVTIIISSIGGVYAVLHNTKKYELTEKYRAELLKWYEETVTVMISIVHLTPASNRSEQKRILLSKLSVLAEVGRFYFPNVDKKDGYGSEKPMAYQGYRHIILEFLLHFYETALQDDGDQDAYLWQLERAFTSEIFKIINPHERIREYSKKTEIIIPKGISLEDYLDHRFYN